MKVWCLFESSEHDDIYERDNDGVSLVGIYGCMDAAQKAMKETAAKVERTDNDTYGEWWCRIELSKYDAVVDSKGAERLDHDCYWQWWIEEREVE